MKLTITLTIDEKDPNSKMKVFMKLSDNIVLWKHYIRDYQLIRDLQILLWEFIEKRNKLYKETKNVIMLLEKGYDLETSVDLLLGEYETVENVSENVEIKDELEQIIFKLKEIIKTLKIEKGVK